MPHGERQVEEERLPGLFLPPHEVDRLGDELVVDLGAHLRREWLHGPQWPAGRRLDDLRTLRQELGGRRRDRVRQLDRADVGRRVPGDVRRNAVELVEAVRRRQALRVDAEVPLPEDCRGVAGILEQLTHRVRLGGQRVAASPGWMISDRPLRIEYCPVISAARDGVQAGSTRYCVSRNPSRANWSRRGVGAPRSSPPP